MVTAIIADDEKNICILLKKLVNWDQLGIQLIGEYYNGKDLFSAIIRDQPDIVVTDILMPEMTGLDIVKNCNARGLDTVFLLISGHAEFEYVHMAIQYGVENYLLKPINQQELERNLEQICSRLNEKVMSIQNNIELVEKLQVSMEIISQQFLNSFLFSPDSIELDNIEQINERYQLHFHDGWFRILTIKPDFKMKYNGDQYKQVLRQILKFVLPNMKNEFFQVLGMQTSYHVILLINYKEEKEAAIQIRKIMDEVQNHFYYYCEVTFGISSKTTDLFRVSLKEACHAELCRTVIGCGKIIDYSGLSYFSQNIPENIYLEKYKNYMEVKNRKNLGELFLEIEGWCKKPNINPESIYDLLKLMGEILTELIEKEIPDWDKKERDYLLKLNCATTLEKMVSSMREITYSYLENQQKLELVKEIKHIAIAKEYVLNHLDENITLNDIAEIVYMNPTYFSTLFKKETGQNFSDYLVEQKILKAKELLKDLSLSISEIGSMVGYQNSRYFSKVFLKGVGIKPSEYRRLHT